jgi:hypothetical protein
MNERDTQDVLVKMAGFLSVPAGIGEVVKLLQLHGIRLDRCTVDSYHPDRGTLS